MARNDFYDTLHANLRLGHTIVLLNKLPIYVLEVRPDWTAGIQYLLTGKMSTLPDIREIEGLDISPVPLGFCQIGENASYLMRMPRRRTKQGLEEASVVSHDGNRASIRQSNTYAQNLGNCITGVYPSLKDATSMLGKGFRSVCVARNWAIMREGGKIDLLYKYYGKVGSYAPVYIGSPFTLLPEYSYLQECLDQEITNA